MTREALAREVQEALADVAPEVDVARLDPRRPLRDQIELDSMDFLRFVVRLHERLGISVPEGDYPALQTIAGCVDYLARAAPPLPPPPSGDRP